MRAPSLTLSSPDGSFEPIGGRGENVGACRVVAGVLAEKLSLLAVELRDNRIQPFPSFAGCHAHTLAWATPQKWRDGGPILMARP